MSRKLTKLLVAVMLGWLLPGAAIAQGSSSFDGSEGLLDPIQYEAVKSLPQVASNATAKAELDKLVADYGTIVRTGLVTSSLRNWGVAKASFYLRWGMSQMVLGVPADQVSTYITRWRTHWSNADRILAAESLKVVPATGTRVLSAAIRTLPASTQQLFRYDLDSAAADAELIANPNILGADPDQLKVSSGINSGCDEFGHAPGVHGRGYAVDRRGLLLDRCENSQTLVHHFVPLP